MKEENQKSQINRSFRYIPLEDYILEIKNNKGEKQLGLIRDESFSGCCAIFRKPLNIKKGEKFFFRSGDSVFLKGKLIWQQELDKVMIKIGIQIADNNDK